MPPLLFGVITVVVAVVFVGLDLRSASFRAGFTTDVARRNRNLGYIVGNVVSMSALNAVNLWLMDQITPLWSWQSLPRVVEVTACVLIAEGINWCSHWVKHQQRWLWTFHVQHHVGRRYDTTLTLHTHGVDVVLTGAVMSAVLLWSGFTKLSVDVFLLLYFATNLYKHGHSRLSLGRVLDKIIVGPAYHRVHHSTVERGNYGSVLTLFDVVFCTAIWPSATVFEDEVGVDRQDEAGFATEMLLPLRSLRGVAPAAPARFGGPVSVQVGDGASRYGPLSPSPAPDDRCDQCSH